LATLDVSGDDGKPAGATSRAAAGGGGGGSGGSLLLSAETLTLEDGHQLVAKGGAGGSPLQGGGAGGAGAVGRIWIGAVNLSGTPNATPDAAVSVGIAITSFPR
jgi:hypothetical protein